MDNEEFRKMMEQNYGAAETALGQQMYQAQTEYHQAMTQAVHQHVAVDRRKENLLALSASVSATFMLLLLLLFIPVYVWLWKWALA